MVWPPSACLCVALFGLQTRVAHTALLQSEAPGLVGQPGGHRVHVAPTMRQHRTVWWGSWQRHQDTRFLKGCWGVRLGNLPCYKTTRPSLKAAAESSSVGGIKTQAVFTALVAGLAVGLLSSLGAVTQKLYGLPLWAPPLGAVALIFASEGTAAAQNGKIIAPKHIWQRALTAGTAVAGACVLSVFVTRLLGASIFGRAVAVGVSSLWMTAMPVSGYFAPAGAFCALFVDQSMTHGAFDSLGYLYALFPCGVGTVPLC